MQVSIETLDGLERKMTVQIPSASVAEAVEQKLRDLSKKVRIDGFRPGKVPLKVVQQKYGAHVRQEVIGDVIESSYQEALIQENLRPAGMPSIDSISDEGGAEVSYTATFEVFPELETLDLASIEVEKPIVDIGDDDFEAMLKKLQDQRKTWKETKAAAKHGFQVMVDFEGRIDGELFEGGAGKDMPVEVGAGQMLEQFDAALDGIKAGEEKTVHVDFPEDYQGQDVAGKTAEFKIRATRVSKPELPEIDAEFARGFGIEDGDIDKMRSDICANMEKERDDRLKMHIKNLVLTELVARNEIIAPTAMVAEEVKNLRTQAAGHMGQDPASVDESSLPDALFVEEAARRVKTGLLIGEVLRREGIELDQAKVEESIEQMAIAYEQPEQVKNYYRQNREARSGVENMVLEDQVIAHILDQAQVSEKQASFEDLMNNSL